MKRNPAFILTAATVAVAFCFTGAPARAAEPVLVRDIGNGVKVELLLVQPGSFTQGSPETEAGRKADEAARAVTLTRPFYLGKGPVTRRQFARFAEESRYKTEAEQGNSGGFGVVGGQLVQRKDFTWRSPGFAQTDEDPVVMVTWPDAKQFTQWVSRKTGLVVSLPSEAEWEYACRAGSTSAWPAGEMAEDSVWHRGNSSGTTHPVGRKAANAWGFADMGGNVFEWCEDWMAPYAAGPVTDPVQNNANLSDKPRRVLRGGSFLREAKETRSAARYRNDPRSRNADNGFRIRAAVPQAAPPPPPPMVERPETHAPAPAAPAAVQPRPAPAPVVQPPVFPHTAPPAVKSGFRFTGLLGLLCPLGIFGVIVFLVKKLMKGMGGSSGGSSAPSRPGVRVDVSPGAPSPAPGGVRTRIAADGFFIQASVAAGTRIAYRAEANGRVMEDTISYQPGPEGQFIYTGAAPTSVTAAIVGSVPPSGRLVPPPVGGSSSFDQGLFIGGVHSTMHDDSPPPPPRHTSRRDPSAY